MHPQTYIYFQVKDFNIAETEEDISTYAGYVGRISIFTSIFWCLLYFTSPYWSSCDRGNAVGSSMMLGRSLTSILWGMISDRYGRKPVIIIGIITVYVYISLK